MNKQSRIFVAGHRGLVGSAISQKLKTLGFQDVIERTHRELDLTNQTAVREFFQDQRPDYVFLAAAKVGGIYANSNMPADFIYHNLMIETNVIDACHRFGIKKLLFLGSSCIYPKFAPQPLKEEYLMTGLLEPTNEPYAMAKLAGISMCQAYSRQYGCNYISVMPTNLYGPNDNFDLDTAHVLPALIRKFHEAKMTGATEVTIWGTGKPRREFLHVDDLAEACTFLMQHYDDPSIINIGTGIDHTIAELAEMVATVVKYKGSLTFDLSKPDGTPRKVLDVSKINSRGWVAKTSLEEGLLKTYEWYCSH